MSFSVDESSPPRLFRHLTPSVQRRMSKEACVVILDVGRGMASAKQGGQDNTPGSGFEAAKNAVRLLIQQKLLFTKRDEMGLLLLGTQDTVNPLNEQHSAGYENISVHREIEIPDLEFLESIDSIETSESETGDAVDALLVGMDMVKTRVRHLKFSKRLFLITDGSAPIEDDPEQLQRIADYIAKEDFHLNVVGVGFADDEDDEENGEDGDGDGQDGSMMDIQDPEATAARVRAEAEARGRTELQIRNEKTLRRLCDACGGVVLSTTDALKLLTALRSRTVAQVTKMRGPMILGSEQWTVWTYGKTMQARLPTLSKRSLLAEKDGTAGVRMERTYRNKLSDQFNEEPVESEDRVRAYRYGKDWVPFPEEVEREIKLVTERSLVVLGFAPRSQIQRQDYLSGVDVVVPAPGDMKAGLMVSALARACFELEQLPVVRYVKRKNSPPLLGVLEPLISTEVEGFYFCQLPFAEDIREFQFSDFVKEHRFGVSPAQLKAAEDLIDAMDLGGGGGGGDGDGDNGEKRKSGEDSRNEKKEDVEMEMEEEDEEDEEEHKELLDPQYTYNPVIQRFYQNVEARALDPTADVAELNPVIAAYVNPDAQILRRAAKAIQRFKNLFPLTPGEEGKEKSGEKRHWRDIHDKLESGVTVDPEMERALGHTGPVSAADGTLKPELGSIPGTGETGGLLFEDVVARQVEEVGTVTPVEDMRQMMDRRDKPFVVPAIQGMQKVILELVQSSFMEQFYEKALECVQELRKACVQHGEAGRFNQGLQELRASCQKPFPGFWGMLVDAEVLPIDREEDPTSQYSVEDAKKFHGSQPEPSVASVDSSAMQDDEDDLWGDMD